MTEKKGPTVLGFALLGLVHQRPMSGYDLRRIFATTPMAHFSSSPGAIYPAIAKLAEAGFVEQVNEEDSSLRPRRLFGPTKAGTVCMIAWMTQEIDRHAVAFCIDELMLRFAFLPISKRKNDSKKFLRGFLTQTEAYIAELKAEHQSMPPDVPLHGRLALEAGIEVYEARRSWAKGVEPFWRSVERLTSTRYRA